MLTLALLLAKQLHWAPSPLSLAALWFQASDPFLVSSQSHFSLTAAPGLSDTEELGCSIL